MRLLFVGDFNITRGTGYSTILSNICNELANKGHEITVLGEKWDRSEHDFPFRVIPTDYSWIPTQVLRLHQALKFDHIILAMDVPKLVQVLDEIKRQTLAWPTTSGLFPIESDPLVSVWARGLAELHRRLVISEFGQRVLSDVGLDSTFIPMTATMPERTVPKPEAREALKERVFWGDPDLLDDKALIALTVADNQERKDLPIIAQALARARDTDKVHFVWALVTVFHSPYGWYLPDVLERVGMAKHTVVFDSLSTADLSRAYFAADCFLLASQAEGACLPLYEAMAHDLPCIAPAHTAIGEALMDGRGTLIHSNGRRIHTWGSVWRYQLQPDDLAAAVVKFAHPSDGRMVDFIKSRPWALAASKVEGALSG